MMRISGVVRDKASRRPLEGARLVVRLGDREVSTRSGETGDYEWGDGASYIGQLLVCRVEKEGFEPKEVTREVDRDELRLDFDLVPVAEATQVEVRVRDTHRNPLAGVRLAVNLDGEQIGIGISDQTGLVKLSLGTEYEGRTVRYQVELAGFETAGGEWQLRREMTTEVVLRRVSPPPPWPWAKIAAGIGAVLVIGILAYVFLIPKHPPPPIIFRFDARPPVINKGGETLLCYSVKNAASAQIDPGPVALDSRTLEKECIRIAPQESTTYTLTAMGYGDKTSSIRTVTVTVRHPVLPPLHIIQPHMQPPIQPHN